MLASAENFDWQHADPFLFQVDVQEADLDSYQHVNNSVYVRWLDDCARAHSLAVGVDAEEAKNFGLGMAVRESRVTYLAAAYRQDQLLIGGWITHNDSKLRLSREFQIMRPADGKLLVTATIDYICINIHTGKAARMPELFKQAYIPITHAALANTQP